MEQNLGVSAEDIEVYLKQHPEFFLNRDKLLKKLHLRHESGVAVSLLERQNWLLRQEVSHFKKRLNLLLENAHANDKLFNQLQKTMLLMLEQTSVNGLVDVLTQNLQEYYSVDAVRVLLCRPPHIDFTNWIATERQLIEEHFPTLIDSKMACCGQFEKSQRSFLFADNSIRSIALAPLIIEDRALGVISLGNCDRDYFKSSMDTLFLSYLAEALSRLIFAFDQAK